MYTKTKLTLVAAFVLGSASALFAQADGEQFQNSQYQLNPNAPVPQFARPGGRALIEGRNVRIDGLRMYNGNAGTTLSDPTERNPSFGGN